MSAEFSIEKVSTGDVTVVRVSGALEARSATQLMNECNDVRRRGGRRLVLNLADVDFIASSGIGTILALCEEFKETGGMVRLAALSEPVRSVVDLLNLTEFLLIDESEDGAIGAIAA